MRFGDRGEDVRQLQRALIAADHVLPHFGADGIFGRETAHALEDFAADLGVFWAPGMDVQPAVLAALHEHTRPAGIQVFDLRGQGVDPHPKSKVKAGKTLRRHPKSITGIVLHQTAIKFGGTPGIWLARRALSVACHAMAFDGYCALAAPLDWYIHHGARFNATTVGLEVDGLYPGLIDGKTYNDRPATPMAEGTIAAAREAVRLLVVEGRKEGIEITKIYAHRQSDSWRRADPGEWLWRKVVLEYAVPVLGLKTEPALTLAHPKGDDRRGLPIPDAWDPDGVGPY